MRHYKYGDLRVAFEERLGEEAYHLGGGAAALRDGGRDVLRALGDAREEHAGGVGLHGAELAVGFHEEPEAVVGDVQGFGELVRALGAFDAHGEHDHVGLHLDGLAEQGVGAADDVLPVPVGLDGGHAAADVLGAVFLDGAAREFVIELRVGADVHVEHVGLRVGDVVLGQDGLLGGVHAAEAGAVGAADGLVAGAHALDEHDALGFLAVGRALDVAAGRAGGGHDALVLERGDDVGVLARAVFAVDRPVHEVVAGGGNDAALLIFLLLAAVMLVLAVRAVRVPAAVPADAASLVAGTDGTHLTISQNGEVILTTAIDVRTLPSADREALRRGITLQSETELTQLLEDYS